jgi:predicted Zn finger-like uncharacterized protein
MFTVCPRCALPLAVTVADLRAGQGYVRCGRCANVFNALLALAEEPGTPSSARPPDLDTASATMSRPALTDADLASAGIASPDPASAEVTGERPEAVVDWVEMSPPPAPQGREVAADTPANAPAAAPALRLVDSPPPPAPPSAPAPAVDLDATGEFSGTSTFETIILEGDTFLQTEEMIPEEVMASELADVSRRIAAASEGTRIRQELDDSDIIELRPEEAKIFELYGAGQEDDAQDDALDADALEEDDDALALAAGTDDEDSAELEALREATGEFRHEANLGAPPVASTGTFPRPSLRPGWKSATLAAVLALLLVGQLVNHWRDDLATRPGWYGPMQGLAGLLGEPLRPNWDLNAYDVRQLGATPEGADNRELRVRLRLANIGTRAQAWPLLRLTLLDRYGKAVSRGELPPAQYLPHEMQKLPFIARDQRVDTEVRVQDPTQQASSFELDVCIAAPGGLRCAGDLPTVASRS